MAKDLAFQTPAITVAADQPVAIVLDNQDGAPHNIAIKDASGADVFKGEIVSNGQVTNQVPALTADLHLPVRGPSEHDGHDHRAVDPGARRPLVPATTPVPSRRRTGVAAVRAGLV